MAKKIDEQVVQLKFDNAQFEKNVNKSMSTLDKLKNALKFKGAEEGINNVQKSMNKLDFSQVENMAVKAGFHIQDVWQKVSSVLEYQIAGRIIHAGENMINALSVDQITAGYSKYEEKTQNIQTLMNSTGKSIEEVNKYLDELMWYSDETSFGFNDMTSALATMTSSGGDIDKLIPMIEGMGNAVAFAGKGAAEFQRVIFNLNQSYSTGSLMTMDWRSVQNAGAASKQLQEYLIEAAEQVGTINKGTGKLEKFSEYLSKKKITSEAMEIAFTRFAEYTNAVKAAVDSGEYETATEAMEHMATDGFGEVSVSAFKAAQNAKSFSEAVDATKDAVSSGWMKIFETIFGNYQESTELWTALCNDLWDIFASGFEGTQDKLDKVMQSKWGQFTDVIDSAGLSVDDFMKSYSEVLGLSEDMSKQLFSDPEKFKKWFEDGTLSSDRMLESIKRLGSGETEIIKVNESAQKLIEDINRVAALSNKEYSNMATKEEKEELISLRKELLKQGNFLDQYNIAKEKSYKNEKLNLFDLSEAQLEHLGYTKEELNQINALKNMSEAASDETSNFYDVINHMTEMSGRELLTGSFANALHGIMQLMNVIKEAWGEVFTGKSSRGWIDILQKIYDWTQKLISIYKNWGEENEALSERGEKLKRTFKGIFAVFDILWQLAKSVAQGIWDLASAFGFVGDSVLDTSASIGDWIVKLDKSIKKNETFKKVIDKIVKAIKTFIEKIRETIKWLKDLWDRIKETPVVREAIEFLEKTFTNALDRIKAAFDDSEGSIGKFFQSITGMTGKIDLDNAADKIVNFFNGINLTTFSEKIAKFKENLKDGKNAFIDFFAVDNKDKLAEDMGGPFGKIGESVGKFTDKIKGKLQGFDFEKFKGLIGIGLGVGTYATLHKTAGVIQNAFKSFTNVGTAFIKTLDSVRSALVTWSLSIKVNALLKIAIAIGILVAAIAALSYLPDEQFPKMQQTLYMILELFGALAVLAAVLGAFKMGPGSAAPVIQIALSLFLIVGALKLLETIPVNEFLFERLIVISLILGELLGIALLLKFFDAGGVNMFGTVIPFALSLLILVGALKGLAKMDAKAIWKGVGALVTLMAALAGAMALMGLWSKAGMVQGKTVLAFVLSIFVLELALKYIAKHGVRAEDILHHFDQFIIVFAAMRSLVKSMSIAGKGNSKNLGLNVLAMAVSILIIGYAMEFIGEIPTDKLIKAGIAVGVMEFVLALCVRLMTGGSMKNSKPIDFKTMIVFVLGVVALCFALVYIQDMPFDKLMKSVGALAVLMIAFGYAVSLINKSTTTYEKLFKGNAVKKVTKVKNSLGGVIAAFVIIAGTIFAFVKFLDPAQLSEVPDVVMALGLCLAAFGAAVWMINQSTNGNFTFDKRKRKTLLLTVASFAAIAAVIFAMMWGGSAFNVNFDKVIQVAAALSLCIVAIGAAMYIMGQTKTLTTKRAQAFLLATLSLIPIAAVLGGLILVVNKFGGNFDDAITIAATLSLCAVAIGAALMVMNIFPAKKPEKAGEALLIGALSLIPIALAIGLMIDMTKGVDIGRMLGIVATLSIALIALTGCLVAITAVTAIPGANGFEAAAVLGLIGLIADVLAGVTLLMADFLGSKLDPEAVSAGLDMIVELVTSIGEAIAGFTLAVIPALGQALSDFATNIQGFIDVVSNIDEGFGERVAWLVLGIMGILAAEVYNAIINFLTLGTGMTQLAVTLAEFGAGVKPFIESLKDLNKDDVDKAGLLADIVLKVTAAEVLEGISSVLKWLTGTSNNAFEETFTSLGKGVAGFADEIKGKSFKNVDTAVKAINAIAGLQDAIGTKGGLKAAIFGESNLEGFGAGMSELGKGIANFCTEIASVTIDDAAIDAAAKAVDPMVDLSVELNNNIKRGGAFQKLFGEGTDLASWGGDLKDFAGTFKDVMEEVNGFKDEIDVDAMQNMADAVSPFMDMAIKIAQCIKGDSAFKEVFTGTTTTLEDFGWQINHFGSLFYDFIVNYANKLTSDDYRQNLMISMMLTDLGTAITTVMGSEWQFSLLGSELASFGGNVKKYSEKIAEADTTNLSLFANHISSLSEGLANLQGVDSGAISSMATLLKTIGDMDADFFTTGVNLINEDFVNKTIELFSNLILIIQSNQVPIKEAMDTTMNEMGKSIDDAFYNNPPNIRARLEGLLTNINTKVRSGYERMYLAGEYLMIGFIAGIKSKMEEARAAAAEIAAVASNATADGLEEKSPSKLYKRIGAYATEGFIIGISSYKKQVYDSGVSLSDAVIEGTNSKIGDFISILSDTDDFNPVIRPTLDLSNVMSGAKQVGAIFNNSKLSASVDGSQNGGKSVASNNVTYNQYNYSPKALSRIDIYRQTRNQLSMSKG